jgi:hypothetical protein
MRRAKNMADAASSLLEDGSFVKVGSFQRANSAGHDVEAQEKRPLMAVVVLQGTLADEAAFRAPSPGFWAYAGNNSGNLLYRHAIQVALAPLAGREVKVLPSTTRLLHDEAASETLFGAAAVLYPTANLLRARSQTNAKVLEECRYIVNLCEALAPVPLLLASLGFEGVAGPDVELHPQQLRMVRAAIASAGAIVLRGETTKAILAANGVPAHCLLPLGCPSVLLTRYDAAASASSRARVGLCLPANFAAFSAAHPALADALRAFAAAPGVTVLCQDAEDLETAEHLGAASRLWTSVPAWLRWLAAEADAVLSFRIHGALAALAAGRPTAVVPVGSRIRELTAQLQLPTLAPSDAGLEAAMLRGAPDARALVEGAWLAALDAARARRDELTGVYTELLQDLVARDAGPMSRPDAAAIRGARAANPYFQDLSDFGLRYALADERFDEGSQE